MFLTGPRHLHVPLQAPAEVGAGPRELSDGLRDSLPARQLSLGPRESDSQSPVLSYHYTERTLKRNDVTIRRKKAKSLPYSLALVLCMAASSNLGGRV